MIHYSQTATRLIKSILWNLVFCFSWCFLTACGSYVEAYHWSFLDVTPRLRSDNSLKDNSLPSLPQDFYLDVKLHARLIEVQSSPGAQGSPKIMPNAKIDSIAVLSLDTLNDSAPGKVLNENFRASYQNPSSESLKLSEFIRSFALENGQIEDRFVIFLENKPKQARQRFILRLQLSDRRVLSDTLPTLIIE
ncbi:MAG: hypothetical protein EAZ57_07165 [Cytophagales bacterium]|nr:MAG: hypothetical protein EAZ67_07975 [Cytophagales bacterium]TAF60481.1 MAG: hypothetical protein EAZ57_07165 [Cytophagales bacterium]